MENYCSLKPLKNGLGYPLDGTSDLYDGFAEDQDVISWSNTSHSAFKRLKETENEVLRLSEMFGPVGALDEFLSNVKLMEASFASLRKDGAIVFNQEEYDARSPALASDSSIVQKIYDLTQRMHCVSELDGANIVNYYEGVADGATEGVEPAHGEVSLTPRASGGGFPWWILILAAGGYAYYRYREGK